MVVVVFIHNVPVRFVNQLKLKGLSRSHPVHVAKRIPKTEYEAGPAITLPPGILYMTFVLGRV